MDLPGGNGLEWRLETFPPMTSRPSAPQAMLSFRSAALMLPAAPLRGVSAIRRGSRSQLTENRERPGPAEGGADVFDVVLGMES